MTGYISTKPVINDLMFFQRVIKRKTVAFIWGVGECGCRRSGSGRERRGRRGRGRGRGTRVEERNQQIS